MADENMVQNAIQPQKDDSNEDDEFNSIEEDESCNVEEISTLNAQLDALNTALDSLEQKNDNIHAALVELLQSNREATKQFQECQEQERLESLGRDS